MRDAMEYLNRLQTELESTPTEYIRAVEQLQRAWTPRYQRAVQEYKRFAYRIDRADAMANEYFEVQEKLTHRIVNGEDRRRAEAIDAAEREVYLDWRDQAFRTLGQAQGIMVDLHDMNVIITKQSLSAHFAALYDEFHTIPSGHHRHHPAPRGTGQVPGRVGPDPADLRRADKLEMGDTRMQVTATETRQHLGPPDQGGPQL